MMLKLLENTFVSQRIEFVHFHSCPQAKLSPKESFLKIYFSPAEREREKTMELKYDQKN